MHLKTKTWLYDIYKSIQEIEDFIGGEMDYDDFLGDLKTIKAVERNIEIIGEASNRIRKKDETIADKISQIRNIVDTRNRISHGYEFVSNAVLWNIVQNDLPILKDEVSKLLED